MEPEEKFEQWAIMEIMGYRKLAGKVSEAKIGAAAFIRIDIPQGKEEKSFTQFYNPTSVYAITPTTEEIARRYAAAHQQEPVIVYDLTQIPSSLPRGYNKDSEDDDE